MKRKTLKTAAGILASLGASALAALLLLRSFEPSGPFSLLGMLAAVWLAGSLAGAKLARGWASGASLILALLLAVTLLLPPVFQAGEGETGRTKYIVEAYFAYLGSEENRPLENVVIALPAPHLENGFPPGDGVGADWSLWYIDENEEWKRQPFFAMHPQRTRMPQILKNVIGITPRGAKLWYCVDLLYPKEAFWVTGTTSSEKKVTLGDLDNNAKTSGIVGIRLSDGQELLDFDNALEFPIKGILWARLLKLVNGKPVVVEEFWRSVENVRGGTFRMYSIDVS